MIYHATNRIRPCKACLYVAWFRLLFELLEEHKNKKYSMCLCIGLVNTTAANLFSCAQQGKN